MTNFERIKPCIETLFGLNWTPEQFAHFYADALCTSDCEETCMIGLTECAHRSGQITFEEAKEQGVDEDEWFDDTGNGKVCEDVILEWLNEESSD